MPHGSVASVFLEEHWWTSIAVGRLMNLWTEAQIEERYLDC